MMRLCFYLCVTCVPGFVLQRSTETFCIGLPQGTCLKKSGGKPVRHEHPPPCCLHWTDRTQTNKNAHHHSSWPSDGQIWGLTARGPSGQRPRVSLVLNALHLSPLWKATAVKAAVKMQSPGLRWAAAAPHGVELNWSSFTLLSSGKKFYTTPAP